MIGTDLNLDLPTLADPMATVVAKIVAALSEIEDSHAEQATPAALNINSNLSFNGNHATNVGGLILADGNAPTSAGSFYYDDGSFYLKDATGIIRLSNAGTIDVTSTGGIGGDYGQGGNPATVTYDDASGQYRFKEDGTTWADVAVDDVLLYETGGTDYVRLSAPASVTSTYTVTFPAAAPGSQLLLQMTSGGTLITSNAIPESISVTGDITASGDLKHGTRTQWYSSYPYRAVTNGSLTTNNAVVFTANDWALKTVAIQLPVGTRLTGAKAMLSPAASAGTATLQMMKYTLGGGEVGTGAFGSAGYSTSNTLVSVTFDTPYTIAADEIVFFRMDGTIQGPTCAGFALVFDRP